MKALQQEFDMHRSLFLALAVAAALPLATTPMRAAAQAQTLADGLCASRSIRLVVPFAAGSAPDILARLLAPPLAESMGVAVTPENLPGAGGTLGVDRVAKAAPDGCTLVLAGDAALVLSGGNYGVNPPYQTLRDLAPIAQIAVTPNVLVVSNEVPARTVQELVALVKSQPGKFSYASAGIGLSTHRGGELMNSMAGLDMVHVPSATNAMVDVMAGRVQLMFSNIAVALPLARDGKLRALAVSSLNRVAAAPELPTVSEAGLPGFESVAWFGLLAPAGTPVAVQQRLEAEVHKALALPAVKERLAAMGATPGVPTAAAFTQVIRADIQKWAAKGPVAAVGAGAVAVAPPGR
jgi:tripartite-type tricarboxylate transporter receptor subunit TctC